MEETRRPLPLPLRAVRASPAPANGSHPARPYPDLSGAGASLMCFHWALWLYSTFSPVGLRSGGERWRQGVRMRPPAVSRVLSCLQQGSAWSRGASGEGTGAARLPLPLQFPLPVPAARHRRCSPLCRKHPKVLPSEAPLLPPRSRDANPQFLWINQGSMLRFPPAGSDPRISIPSLWVPPQGWFGGPGGLPSGTGGDAIAAVSVARPCLQSGIRKWLKNAG